jgi:hypothetical protein
MGQLSFKKENKSNRLRYIKYLYNDELINISKKLNWSTAKNTVGLTHYFEK